MSYDPTEYDCIDEHVPDYAELEGIDQIISDEEFTHSLRDETYEINDLDDIPY